MPVSGRRSGSAEHPVELDGEVLEARFAHPALKAALRRC
jgi:hypothetical protein